VDPGKMVEEEKEERSERYESTFKVTFNGTSEKWKDFYDKFRAYGEFKGWWYTLLTAKSDQDSTKAKQDRARAKYALTMCVTGDAAKYVRAYKNDPYEGWKAITDRWELLDGSDLKDLYKKWDGVLDKGPELQDPKLWFLELSDKEHDIVEAGGNKKGDSEFLALLEKTLEGNLEYQKIVTLILLQEKNNDLTYWKDQLFSYWKRNLRSRFVKKSEGDVAFYADKVEGNQNGGGKPPWKKTSYKPFKGICNKCGKVGHKAFQCRSAESTNSGAETRKCFNCHVRGHIAKDCPKKKARQSDGPEALFVGMIDAVATQDKVGICHFWVKLAKERRTLGLSSVRRAIPKMKPRRLLNQSGLFSINRTGPNSRV
jgi:hypothetical protein